MNYPTLPSQSVNPVSGNRAAILAEKYCCNWHNHVCVGTEVDLPTGLQVRWRPEGSRCLLADGKRCPYFEQSVLPMEKWQCQIWVRIAGEYPVRRIASKLKVPGTKKAVAEWRGGGGSQSVIQGVESKEREVIGQRHHRELPPGITGLEKRFPIRRSPARCAGT